MSKLLLCIVVLLLQTFNSISQTVLFSENFDGVIQMNSNGNPGWASDDTLSSSPQFSWQGRYLQGNTVTTETLPFSTLGMNTVILNFNQICKIETMDTAKIELSLDGGITWAKLNSNYTYNGQGLFSQIGYRFNESSYVDWQSGLTNMPTNAWWKPESFDISRIASNKADVRIRFTLVDVLSNGMNGRAGWYLDDIEITAVPCETIPPLISLCYTNWQGIFWGLQQFYDVFIYATDSNGINSAELYWTINSDPTVYQAFGLINLFDSVWAGTIYNPNGPFVDGDSICYWVTANDASGCSNQGRMPDTGAFCNSAIICLAATYPFCDDFDSTNIYNRWASDTISTGSPWLIGAPNQTILNNPHSATNVIGLELTGNYQNNSKSYIYSVPFNFTVTPNTLLKFWHNRSTESGHDGVNFQYTNDGGQTWNVLGTANDPMGTNWYTSSSVLSSNGEPVWDGQSNGWVQSTYKLAGFTPIATQENIQFRFAFYSDSTITDNGFNMDDFCLELTCPADYSVQQINSANYIPVGTNLPISVLLGNLGSQNQDTTLISYQVNGGTVYTTNFYNTIVPGQQTYAAFNTTVLIPDTSAYEICVWVDLPGDCDHSNDTLCEVYYGVPILTGNTCDDFESGSSRWESFNFITSGAGTNWELGTPAFGQTNSAFSGVNAWDINLNSAYGNNALTFLKSPYYDFSGTSSATVSFDLNWNILLNDGVRLEYTLDNGATWIYLGSGNILSPDPCALNWYTNDSIHSSSLPGWDGTSTNIAGNSNGWVHCNYGLCCAPWIFQNQIPIQFRFVFTSDSSGVLDGVSMDNFCINDTLPCIPAGIQQTSNTNLNLIGNYPNPTSESTTIEYIIPTSGSVKITMHDMLGHLISTFIDDNQTQGRHTVEFDTKNFASGIYTYTLTFNERQITKRLVITK